jgi:hypothetical protein
VITTPTVLVLGAGASVPYGFPSAAELKTLICNEFATENTVPVYLNETTNFSTRDFVKFRNEFRKSGQVSVDAFLEYRQEFLPLGKLAIAHCLVPYEDEEKLFQNDPLRGGDWYEYLFGKLKAPFEEFGQNKLSVITFNYDRSLEHYLLTVLQHSHKREFNECADMLAHIPIVHVYGQLSQRRYSHPEARIYRPDLENFGGVRSAAAGIKILHETEPKFDQAHKLLTAADRVCFLGFGYHPLNIERLQLKDSSSQRYVFGTVRGLETSEIKNIQAKLAQTLLCPNITLNGEDNLVVLRRFTVLG